MVNTYVVVCNQRQFASSVMLPALVVQLPAAVHVCQESDGWASAVSVPTCWADTTARRVKNTRTADRNIVAVFRGKL